MRCCIYAYAYVWYECVAHANAYLCVCACVWPDGYTLHIHARPKWNWVFYSTSCTATPQLTHTYAYRRYLQLFVFNCLNESLRRSPDTIRLQQDAGFICYTAYTRTYLYSVGHTLVTFLSLRQTAWKCCAIFFKKILTGYPWIRSSVQLIALINPQPTRHQWDGAQAVEDAAVLNQQQQGENR